MENVVNNAEDDDNAGDENAVHEVSKKVPNISLTASFDLLWFFLFLNFILGRKCQGERR